MVTINNPSINLAKLPVEQAMGLSLEGKLQYFHQVRVNHPEIKQVLSQLDVMTQPNVGTDIALLIGPTGVGKSTMVQALTEMVVKRHQEELQEDPGFIPIVSVEAPASGEQGFSWRIFYRRLGEALNEPLLARKQETLTKDGRTVAVPASSGATVAALRVAIETALKQHRTRVFIVDEAVHLIRNIKGSTVENHMDALKSLANICGVKLVLVGSYDLYALMNLSAQVARRTTIFHLKRYAPGADGAELAFRKVLEQLERHFPVEGKLDFGSRALELQEACAGCVGILKDTLSRALSLALMQGRGWSMKYLEQALLTPNQLGAVLNETLRGEAQIFRTCFGSGSFRAASECSRKATLRNKGNV